MGEHEQFHSGFLGDTSGVLGGRVKGQNAALERRRDGQALDSGHIHRLMDASPAELRTSIPSGGVGIGPPLPMARADSVGRKLPRRCIGSFGREPRLILNRRELGDLGPSFPLPQRTPAFNIWRMTHPNDGQSRAMLQDIARRAMLARGLAPDFTPAALDELATIRGHAVAKNASTRDLRHLLWCLSLIHI